MRNKTINTRILLLITAFALTMDLVRNDCNLGGYNNIIADVTGFVFVFFMYLAVKDKDKKIQGYKDINKWVKYLFTFGLAIGCIDLLIDLYPRIINFSTYLNVFINGFYLSLNIIVSFIIFKLMLIKFRKLDILRLNLNFILACSLFVIAMWPLLFEKLITIYMYNKNIIYLASIFVLTNLYIIMSLSMLFENMYKGQFNKSIKYFILGIILFIIPDILTVFKMFFYEISGPVSYMLRTASFYIICLGVLSEEDFLNVKKFKSINQNKNYVFIILALILIVVEAMFRIVTLDLLIILTIVSLGYIILNRIIEKLKDAERDLENEKKLNKILEDLVEMKTLELQEKNKKLNEMVNKDSLTKIYNVKYLKEVLNEIIVSNEEFALLYMDLNDFKSINDTYGHNVGDEIIKETARKISKVEIPDKTVFRVGGDEFVILIKNPGDKDILDRKIEKIIEEVEKPFIKSFVEFNLSTSIGVALYPENGSTREEIIHNSDIAMYYAKHKVKNRNYSYYTESLGMEQKRKKEIDALLKNANYDEEFTLNYQGIFDGVTGELFGIESLLKWTSKEKGEISPLEFIPIGKENGEIIKIGKWVIKEAAKQVKKWKEQYNIDLMVNVNLSSAEINSVGFFPYIEKLMKENLINSRNIAFEINEETLVSKNSMKDKNIENLRKYDFSVIVEGCGENYASLAYIKRYDLDKIKLSKSLVKKIDKDKNSEQIARAIIKMSEILNLDVMAQGVENKNQDIILKKNGCKLIEGFYYLEPLSPKDFQELCLDKIRN